MNLEYMKKALKYARNSEEDIPIGALIVKNNEIISIGVNERERAKNAVNHAEILAIQRANKKLNNWRLTDCEMYVTLEPCFMCAAAILQSGIKSVYFGAYDFLNGALGSKADLQALTGININVKGGIMEEECSLMLKEYFKNMRKK